VDVGAQRGPYLGDDGTLVTVAMAFVHRMEHQQIAFYSLTITYDSDRTWHAYSHHERRRVSAPD